MAPPWVPEVFSRERPSFRGSFPKPETAHEKPLAPRLKWTFPFDKIVVPSTALLYPSYKNNNQKRGGLGRICATGMYLSIGHVDFPKFQSGICVEWKVLLIYRVIKSKPVSKVFVSEQSATTLLRARENIAKTGFCKVVTVCHPFSLLRI